MEYTSEQLENIIKNQLTDSERSGILCYIIGYLSGHDNPELREALNSAIDKMGGVFIKSKVEAKA